MFQMKTCSSEDLDCVETVMLAARTEECPELCEGTIVDVTRLASTRDETVMASFIRDYQRYKYPLVDNIRKGK